MLNKETANKLLMYTYFSLGVCLVVLLETSAISAIEIIVIVSIVPIVTVLLTKGLDYCYAKVTRKLD